MEEAFLLIALLGLILLMVGLSIVCVLAWAAYTNSRDR